MHETDIKIRLGYCFENQTYNLHSGPTLDPALTVSLVFEQFKRNLAVTNQILTWNLLQGISLFRLSEWFLPPVLFKTEYNWLLDELSTDLEAFGVVNSLRNKRRVLIHLPSNLHLTDNNEKAREHIGHRHYTLKVLGLSDGVIECHLGLRPGKIWHPDQILRYLNRIVDFIMELPAGVRGQLAFENDKQWTVPEVLYVCEKTSCAFIYDIAHHELWPQNFPFTEENIDRAIRATVDYAQRFTKLPPVFHLSSQDPLRQTGQHNEYVGWTEYEFFRRRLEANAVDAADILIEAGGAEKAILQIRNYFNNTDSIIAQGEEIAPR